MKIFLNIKSLFTFKPPEEIYSLMGIDQRDNLGTPEYEKYFQNSEFVQPPKEIKSDIGKIWLDNVFRVWMVVASLIITIGLRISGTIVNFLPIGLLFFVYIFAQSSSTFLLMKLRRFRIIDYFLCAVDIAAISMGIFLTGGITSPLYFLFFVPIIIQAFHKDWSLILFNGICGIIFYSAAILSEISLTQFELYIDLVVRIFCMMITIGTALLAVKLLKSQQEEERKRLMRMNILTTTAQTLNNLTAIRDLKKSIETIVQALNAEYGKQINGWSRIFISGPDGQSMHAISNPNQQRLDLKQEISLVSCPAIATNSNFYLENAEQGNGCPTESFSFKSHLCVPISGSANETFGVIFSGSNSINAFKKDDSDFLRFIARAVGLTVQRLNRVEELQKSMEMDSCAMATFLASTKGVPETRRAILEGIKTILRADQCSLILWDSKIGNLKVVEAVGPHAIEEKNLVFKRGEGVVGTVFETGNLSRTFGLKGHELANKNNFPFKSILCLPLQSIKGIPIGVINVWHLEDKKDLSSFDIDLGLTFITRATLAIENSLMHERNIDSKITLSDEETAAAA